MAVNASERLRLAYEYKLGKDLTSKLSDDQIKKLSQYYNSLPPNEQSKVDSDIIKGGGEFLDIARGMDGMMEVEMEGDKKFTLSLKRAGTFTLREQVTLKLQEEILLPMKEPKVRI